MQEGTKRPHETERKTLQKAGFENWFDRRQCSAGTESQHSNESRRPVSHRLRYTDGGDGFQSETSQKRRMMVHAGMPSKHRSEPVAHNKINRKVSHPTKKGYTANRPPPKLKDTSETWNLNSSTFEVNLSDFPELCDATPSTHKSSLGQEPKTPWGPVKPAAIPDSPAAIIKEQSPNNIRQKSSPQVTPIEKTEDSSTAFPGRENDLVSSNTYGSPATSWASIASQSPKVIPRKSAPRESSPQVDTGQLQAGQKKKRKKKKKSKTGEQIIEEEEEAVCVPLQQVPPKIEDDEEFPNLFSSLGHLNRGPRQTLPSEMQVNTVISKKEASSLQSENKNTSNAAEGKIVSTTQKKGQQLNQKKSKALVQLDLGNMLTVLEQKQHSKKSKQDVKPIILSVGGALPVVYKEPTQKKHSQLQEHIAHNPLDSTSPLVKKGKQREVPKAKKPSPLKRVILKEREERKQNRLLEEMDPNRLTSNASKVDLVSSATENSSEISSAQPCHDPTGEQSDAEMDDHNDSQSEENAPSKDKNPNSSFSRPKIHSRKFRDYCSQMLSKDVDECVTTLLKELVRFQDRLYQKDPMKARMKRRLVMGLREVLKHLKLRKVKCVIISPNCERVQSKGGLDEALHTIIDTCREQCVPFVFALSRKSLGRCVNKAVPVTLVGIFNYDGAQDHYHKMIELSSQARKAYEVMVADLEGNFQEQSKDEGEMQQETEPPPESTATEEPEYIKIWKRVLANDYNHKFLPFEEHFSSMAIGTDVEAALNDYSGS